MTVLLTRTDTEESQTTALTETVILLQTLFIDRLDKVKQPCYIHLGGFKMRKRVNTYLVTILV